MTLLRKEGSHLYNSIGHILIGIGLTEDVAYGTLNRSVEKLGLSPGCVQEDNINGICDNLEVALCISLDTKRMSDLRNNIYKLKGSASK
ncbi:MAG: hypothetical protein KJ697_03015 [Nanoarchaeota archaeon]|nr:hypothetical protein [Nanoarchaeota archaeon]